MAPRDGPSNLSRGRLGRARRLRCHGPWQFGAAISCELGHRARRCRTVRAARARGAGERPADVQIPPPRRWAHHHQRRRRWRYRLDPRAGQHRAGKEQFAEGHRRIHATRAGGDRRLRRYRRQSRSGSAELAEAPGERAEEHDLRRARACRWADDRHHRGCRRAADQPRPDVALRRGHQELVADLAAPRHPNPAGTILDVVRRHRQAARQRRCFRGRIHWANCTTS